MIIIFDGNNLAYRCTSVTDLRTRQGKPTSAIYGVINSVMSNRATLEKLKGVETSRIIMAWDFGKSDRRRKLFPEYKVKKRSKQTPEEEESKRIWYEEFIEQTNYLHEVLPYFGVKSLKYKGWEADDVIYALTKVIGKREIVIVSMDNDYTQLVTKRISVYHPIKNILYTKENFREHFEIDRDRVVLFKSLKGDDSDGIPGIKGVGDKRGMELANKYETLEDIKADAPTLSSKAWGRELLSNIDIV